MERPLPSDWASHVLPSVPWFETTPDLETQFAPLPAAAGLERRAMIAIVASAGAIVRSGIMSNLLLRPEPAPDNAAPRGIVEPGSTSLSGKCRSHNTENFQTLCRIETGLLSNSGTKRSINAGPFPCGQRTRVRRLVLRWGLAKARIQRQMPERDSRRQPASSDGPATARMAPYCSLGACVLLTGSLARGRYLCSCSRSRHFAGLRVLLPPPLSARAAFSGLLARDKRESSTLSLRDHCSNAPGLVFG